MKGADIQKKKSPIGHFKINAFINVSRNSREHLKVAQIHGHMCRFLQ